MITRIFDRLAQLGSGSLVRGRTAKIVQLIGEKDREHPERLGSPGTFTKYDCQLRLYGADVGAPLDFGPDECLWLLFGDSWTASPDNPDQPAIVGYEDHPFCYPYADGRPFNADCIGVVGPDVTAEGINEDLKLDFLSIPEPNGGYATLQIPGVNLLTNRVPTGAIRIPRG